MTKRTSIVSGGLTNSRVNARHECIFVESQFFPANYSASVVSFIDSGLYFPKGLYRNGCELACLNYGVHAWPSKA